MSTAKSAMVALQRGIRKWEPLIRRATHCSSIAYQVQDTGNFTVIVKWPGGEHSVLFEREKVFPHISAGVAIRPKKRVCRYVDDIILEVLQARKQ